MDVFTRRDVEALPDSHTTETGPRGSDLVYQEQISRYMGKMGMDHGYLILFEIDPKIPWKDGIYKKEVKLQKKRITLLAM